jgi:hypothetical protein
LHNIAPPSIGATHAAITVRKGEEAPALSMSPRLRSVMPLAATRQGGRREVGGGATYGFTLGLAGV